MLRHPSLAFADLKRPFLLETDASKYGLGAILQQVQEDGKYHPVAYASSTLCRSEANYHSSKLEFLALKVAMTQQLKEYLMYLAFTMWTNNKPTHICANDTELRCHQTPLGFSLGQVQLQIGGTYMALTTESPMYWAGWKLDWMITPPTSSCSPWTSHPMMPRMPVTMQGRRIHGPLTKIEKNAVNEIMERAQFQSYPTCRDWGYLFGLLTDNLLTSRNP